MIRSYLSSILSASAKSLTIISIVAASSGNIFAEESVVGGGIRTDKNLIYRLPATPEHIDNYLYSTYTTTGKSVYNLKGFEQVLAPNKIYDLKINPAGHSFAVIVKKGKQAGVRVYTLNQKKQKNREIKLLENPTAIGYTADSRQLAVADGNKIYLYDSRTLNPMGSVNINLTPTFIEASPDGRYLIAGAGKNADIINMESGAVRKSIFSPGDIAGVSFNNSGSSFAVLTDDGKVTFYDTADLSPGREITVGGRASSIDFHPEDKYIAVAHDGDKVTFINVIDDADRFTLTSPQGGITEAAFLRDGKENVYISYTAPESMVYKRILGFSPNFTRLLEEELDRKMLEWSKMKPFETEEEYKARVNEETRQKQRKLFANSIATSLAGDLISRSDVTLGKYDREHGTLIVGMGNLPSVYLTVPENEVTAFTDASDLEFRNPVYGLTPDDTFELIYAEVYNKNNGKTYVFDNLDRQNLSFLNTDDSFISLDLLQKSSMEDAILQNIKEEVLKAAYTADDISEHTQIDVSTSVVSDVDAEGKRINNYKVDFTYAVEPEFSVKEDFPAGKYLTSESPAAEAMLSIVKRAFEGDFSQYVKPGKKLVITITGSADALPIGRRLPYADQYGAFEDEPCRIDGALSTISVDAQSGITTNEQLAFIRAQGVRHYLSKNLPQLAEMNPVYNYNVEVSKEKGGAYRRISVGFLFVDAL